MADLLEPGQLFVGRYRVERALAQGGMGAVFVAEQLATEATVAIKVLFPQILGSRDAVEKFQFEAKVAARVNSEHIVKVLDAGYDEESGLPFLVMELLRGQELDELVERGGPLSPVQAAEYVRQVASGLDRAHGYVNREGQREPIVHRDLKPENIFLAQRDSGEPVVKILDFGIAKVLSDTAKVSQEIKGTPLYMAYEQATGSALSPQTDIWALGLITFYLLTGQIYWKSASNPHADVTSLFAEVLSLPLDPPTNRIRELGQEPRWQAAFDAWFARCVVRDPAARFGSAGEAARELARALGVSDQLTPSSGSRLDRTLAASPDHLGATRPSGLTPTSSDRGEDTQSAGTPPRMATEGVMSMAHTQPSVKPSSPSKRNLGWIGVIALVLVGALALAFTWNRRGDEDQEALSEDPAKEPVARTVEEPDAVVPEPGPAAQGEKPEEKPSSVEKPAPPPQVRATTASVSPAAPAPPRPIAPAASQPRRPASPAPIVTRPPAPAPQPARDPYGER